MKICLILQIFLITMSSVFAGKVLRVRGVVQDPAAEGRAPRLLPQLVSPEDEGDVPLTHQGVDWAKVAAAPTVAEWDWSMVEAPLDLPAVPDILRPRLEDFLAVNRIMDQGFDDFDALRARLQETPFHSKDYKILHEHIKKPTIQSRGISILCVTHRPRDLPNILNNFRRAAYADKELILVLNGKAYDARAVEETLAQEPDDLRRLITVIDSEREGSLAHCLNVGTARAGKDIITKLDGDDIYGTHYLRDVARSFDLTDTDVSGKQGFFFWQGLNRVTFRGGYFGPRLSRFTGGLISGATLTFKKEIAAAVPFTGSRCGEDTRFLEEAARKGCHFTTSDAFNALFLRNDNPDLHTWGTTSRGDKMLYDARNVNGIFA